MDPNSVDYLTVKYLQEDLVLKNENGKRNPKRRKRNRSMYPNHF